MAKVLLFGTGGVGGIYAYFLQRGGAEVTAVCRSNHDVVKEEGFKISSNLFGEVNFNLNVIRDVGEIQMEWDFVVVCSKAFPGTASLIKPAIQQTTSIVLCQNGIDIEDEYAEAYPSNTIISGVVYLPTTQVRPGVIHHREIELLEIGGFPSTSSPNVKQKVLDFQHLFTAGGGTAKVYDDIQSRRWSKLLVNASWNPICALTLGKDVDVLTSSDMAVDFIRDVMLEVVAIAQSLGYSDITAETVKFQLDRAKARVNKQGVEPSMLTDVLHKRPLEIEAIVGNAVRLAKKQQVRTPLLDAIYVLTKALDKSIAQNG